MIVGAIYIKPTPWERPYGRQHRYMSKGQRQYYSSIYSALTTGGVWPFHPQDILSLNIKFYRKIRTGIPDLDNLIKAFLDAGQPSRWAGKEASFLPDLWNDKQFSKIYAERLLRQSRDSIYYEIEKGETK